MTLRWYVIRSKPRKENFLAEQMQMRIIEDPWEDGFQECQRLKRS